MLYLALDPAIKLTGWCLLEGEGRDGRMRAAGLIRTKDASIPRRAWELSCEVKGLIAAEKPDVVCVELPLEQTRGMGKKRSATTGPSYGIAVGAVIVAVLAATGRVLTVPAGVWSKEHPKTGRDRDKVGRVIVAASIYGIPMESLGARSVAGNVADAILLARWAYLGAVGGDFMETAQCATTPGR